MTEISIIRQPDDAVSETYINLGVPHGYDGFYLVFKGDPEKAVRLLRKAASIAEFAIPQKMYTDHSQDPTEIPED